MGCVSSLSVTVSPERGYWNALIEFMRMRQQRGWLDDASQQRASFVDVKEYSDAGIAAAINTPDDKAKFSDQEIENCGYLGWVACAN